MPQKTATRPYQICNRCVMDTSDEDIRFDNEGYCNHCTAYLKEWDRAGYRQGHSETAWATLAATIKKARTKEGFDCLMGVSGGADSSYAVWLAVQSGLRPLLYHVDNGWNTELSMNNIQRLTEHLGLQLITVRMPPETFRAVQLAFLKSSIVDIEIPTDLSLPAVGFQLAEKHGIRYLLSGGDLTSEGILPLTWGYHVMRDRKLYRHIVKTYGNGLQESLPYIGIRQEAWFKLVWKIKTIYILNYFSVRSESVKAFLKEKFSWQDYGGKHHESVITAFWQGYVMPVKWGMDYRRATYSSKICVGQLSREEALHLLQLPPYDLSVVEKQKEIAAKFFKISLEELEDYLSLPPKTYKDFPNNCRRIQQVFKLYKKVMY